MEKLVEENYLVKDERITKQVFKNQCFKCKSVDNLCIDHHYPLNDGNALTVVNATVLCCSCNCSKGSKQPEEFYTEKELIEINELFKKAEKMKIDGP